MPMTARTFARTTGIAILVLLASSCGDAAKQTDSAVPQGKGRGEPPPGPRQEEGERPPIVVSSGSIEFYIDWDHFNRPRGAWKNNMTDKSWLHDFVQTETKTLTEFTVHVLNGEGGQSLGGDCTNADKPFVKVTSVKVGYGPGNTPRQSATVSIKSDAGKRTVAVDFAEDARKTADIWLHAGGGDKLQSVTLTDGASSVTCKFDNAAKRRGVVTIRQIMK